PMANQGGIPARAERQRKCIQEDRFAGTGFAGEHRKAGGEIDFQPLDQHDVPDRKPAQHAALNSRLIRQTKQTTIRNTWYSESHSVDTLLDTALSSRPISVGNCR